jgi:hypothetical protein
LQHLSPRRALIKSRLSDDTFESQLRSAAPKAAIVAPDEDGAEDGGFDAHLENNFENTEWSRLSDYIKPLALSQARRSWVYRHGWRVTLLKDPDCIFSVCRYCHKHRLKGGIYEATRSPKSAARYLEEQKHGHRHRAPGKAAVIGQGSILRRVLKDGKITVAQATANELSGFNTTRFRLVAVTWLVDNNHPLSEFKRPSFRTMLAMANPEAEAALWTSSMSVSSYVLHLYDYLKPRIVKELSQALSKIHVSFDGWTKKDEKHGYLGIVVHYVNTCGNLQGLPVALPQLTGAHSGQKMAEIVFKTLDLFGINGQTVGYFVLDNASNNNLAIAAIGQNLGFSASDCRHRCGPHMLNPVGQRLLWGQDEDAYNNSKRKLADKTEFMGKWRRDGPLGVLLSIINCIKTPQQYELFSSFQMLAHRELPNDAPEKDCKVLEPVKPIVTRWNSYYSCFERAVKLQSAVNVYADYHIRRVQDEDTYTESRGNKLPKVLRWMQLDGLTAADWAVVTEYLDVLKPLKSATRRLEGRGKSGRFGAIAEIIPVFEYTLSYYKQPVKAYETVDYNAHNEAPEDHLAINLRTEWATISEYYTKLDNLLAYYAASIPHPYYQTYCDTVWNDKPEWLVANNCNFCALWQLYSALPCKVRCPKVLTSDMYNAIDGRIKPSVSINNNTDNNESEQWKRSEPRAEKGSNHANNPIKYWVELCNRYPNLSKLALDVLCIPASSCECERLFSELGDLLEPCCHAIKPQPLAAMQCVRRW